MTILAACAPVPSTLNSAHLPDLAPDSQGLHWRGVLAAVDLGSNSFRLELAQIREAATSASPTSRRWCDWAAASMPAAG